MTFFDKLKSIFRISAKWGHSPRNNNGTIIYGGENITVNAGAETLQYTISAQERKILRHLARGGRCAVALNEFAAPDQVNIYGVPGINPNDLAFCGEELNVFADLLEKGLISQTYNGSQLEYVITGSGRKAI